MKKKILVTAMSSVMALSGAASSLTAFADVADFKTQSATKADLKKLIEDKEIVDLVDNDGISQYGSISGANFLKAVDYAKAVLEDVESTNDQATVAYLMVKAAKENLKQYTKEELQLLVAECRSKYDTNNLLNERGDARFTNSTWQKFVEAFEEADIYKDYDDILVTTDAYEKLEAAKNPEELPTKTKTQIDTARRNYEKALQLEYKYQPWIRGTVTAAKTDYDGKQFAWGILYQHVKSGQTKTQETYDTFDKIKGLNVTSDPVIVAAVDALEEAAAVLNGFSASYETGSTQGSVNNLLKTYHGQLVYTYNNATTTKAIIDSLISALDNTNSDAYGLVKVKDIKGKFNTIGSGVVNGSGLISSDTEAAGLWATKYSAQTKYQPLGGNASTPADKVEKLISASLEIQHTKKDTKIYYILDNNNKLANGNGAIYDGEDGATYFYATETAAKNAAKSGMAVKYINPNTGFKLSDYIPVTSLNILADPDFGTVPGSVTITGDADRRMKDFGTSLVSAIDATSGLLDQVATAIAALKAESSTDKISLSAGSISSASLASINNAYDAVTVAMDAVSTIAAKCADDTVTRGQVLALSAEYAAFNTAIGSLKSALDDVEKAHKATGNTELKGRPAFVAVNDAWTKGTDADSDGTIDDDEKKLAVSIWFGTGSDCWDKVKNAWLAGYNEALLVAIDARTLKANKLQANGTAASIEAWKANNVVDVADELSFNTDDDGYTNKGIVFIPTGKTSVFTLTSAYTTTRTGDKKSSETTPNLAKAMVMFENFNVKYWSSVETLDNIMYIPGEIKDDTAVQARAWTMLYTYMKYALEDEFKASADKTYTLKDVKKLLDDSYTLSTQTVETALFNTSHMNLFNDRNGASDWVKRAEGSATGEAYKDNDTAFTVTVSNQKNDGKTSNKQLDSTSMYNWLKKEYDALNKELSAFKYSYGDIITEMALIAKAIDGNDLSADVKTKLTKDLLDTASAFVKVEAVKNTDGDELEDSGLFNANGTINIHNRLFTNKDQFKSLKTVDGDVIIAQSKKAGDKNETHYNMQVAYEKLVADYEAATKAPVSQVTNDVDGSGKFDLADVVALLKLNVDNKMDVNKHDINGDKKVDLQDVVALLKAYTAS